MTDVMLDLETLSTKNNAIILVIGAIKFNRNEKWDNKFTIDDIHSSKKFYKRIKISSCEEIGLHKDKNTELWWNNQDPSVKEEAFGFESERVTITDALKQFSEWFKGSTFIWGNGSVFDITIISEAYNRCNLEIPWKFFYIRDLRTLFDICNFRSKKNNHNNKHNHNNHNAIYDCFYQIKDLQQCFSE
jgi:hypothetical protein